MALAHSPRIVTDGLVLALDAGNTKSYNAGISTTAWTDLTNIGTPAPNTGYFGGGYSTSNLSTMDKVTYASDTTAAVPSAALSLARYGLAATGSSTAGYFGGGATFPPILRYSTMDKVTYASDTTAAVPGASLSAARVYLAATGNSTAGYFGGGTAGTSYSTMDKVTYSTDTTAAVPGAALSAGRLILAATGNSTHGYFGGGSPALSTMNKVTYSTDTTAAVPGAALSVARRGLTATGNSTAGYFGGGVAPGPLNFSTMDKVTYSSDTTAAVLGAALSVARDRFAATGNSTAGYFGGGVPGPLSTMDKVTYSTDTTAAVPGAALSAARYILAVSSARANALPQPTDPSIRNKSTLVATPTYSTTNGGYFGFASASSQYATAPDLGSLSQWTVEAVVRFTADYGTKVAMVVGNRFDGASSLNFTIGTNNAPANYNIAVGFFDGAWRSTTGVAYSQNTWIHITGTYDGSTIRQFTNGAEVDSLSYSGTPTSGGEIRINRRWDDVVTSGNLFDSDIGIVRIYNRALTPLEISQNFNALRGRYGI